VWYFAGMKKRKGLESQLRQAILDSKLSRYKISQLTGVDKAQLSYFVHGKRTLTLESAEKIAEVLKLELKPKKKRKSKKAR
jgi:transcriptional regulator with XRE-family HTH domain